MRKLGILKDGITRGNPVESGGLEVFESDPAVLGRHRSLALDGVGVVNGRPLLYSALRARGSASIDPLWWRPTWAAVSSLRHSRRMDRLCLQNLTQQPAFGGDDNA